MSRIGRLPIPVPSGVDVAIDGQAVSVKGPEGHPEPHRRRADRRGAGGHGQLKVTRPSDDGPVRALHGLSRTLIANMVTGVTTGFSKTLEIVGVGYRVAAKGKDLEFSLGFSHPVLVTPPEGITFRVEAPTRFVVEGIDKQLVGETAARIRKLRKPDPYKAKGVRRTRSFAAAVEVGPLRPSLLAEHSLSSARGNAARRLGGGTPARRRDGPT